MECWSEEENIGAQSKAPLPNSQIFPVSSTPFALIHPAPFLRQPSLPNFQFLAGASNGFCEFHKSIVERFLKIRHHHIGILDKVVPFCADLQNCFQMPRRNNQKWGMLSTRNFAAILPGDSVAGIVVANGISNFFSIYNTLLIVRLVLTWFPNAPPAVVSPLSTICDPYLNIFRGLIPPLGGTLDLSPILAFLVLNAFTSSAAALPAELPPTNGTSPSCPTTSQEKWMRRLNGTNSTSDEM